MRDTEKLTLIGVFLNLFLFVGKFIIGTISNSLSLLSDAFNSLADIISYSGIYLAVKIAHKHPDHDHPFGHKRAEPIAAFVISIFTFILAFEILKNAVFSFFTVRTYQYESLAAGILIITMLLKIGMYYLYNKSGKENDSPALRAGAVDSKNDALTGAIALIGVMGPWLGVPLLDSISALLIGFYILYSGYKIAKENLDYLMGKSPSIEIINKIKSHAMKTKGVKGINDVRAHYIGHHIHIEIHIEVDKNLSTKISHDIGKDVEKEISKVGFVDKAFVHIDPV